MFVTHSFENRRISREVNHEVGFLVTNRIGGFLNLGIATRYRGLFFSIGNELYKIIDDIRIKEDITEIRNNFWHTIRCRNQLNESFFMPFGTNDLVHELSEDREIDYVFDVKKPYDNRIWGRIYNVYIEKGKAIIEYTKNKDSREDSDTGMEYKLFSVIDCGNNSYQILDEWENQFYGFDKSRNSAPFERHTYKCLRVKSNRIIISSSDKKEDAIKSCENIGKHLDRYKALQKKYSKVSIKNLKDTKHSLAAKAAIEALDGLTNKNTFNIYAGLPWFFQHWSRDSLISLNALIIDKEYDTVKRILMNHIHQIQDDGLLPNIFPGSAIKSCDSIGWYFKRWDDFLRALRKDKQLKSYLNKEEVNYVVRKLEDSINKVFKNFTVDNLAINKKQETWMDTLVDGEGRDGARIEIQALRLSMYDFMYKVTENRIYNDMLQKLKHKTREFFWTGEYLKDGVGDETITPNVFIAAYIYPELLSKEEWKRCFNHIIPKLWLTWGGFSTIDIGNRRFSEQHTGEDPKSYHRGDSWYWVNNLAALVLSQIDYDHFQEYVDKIIEASCEDILFKGFIGCHSELSSASSQKAEGCLCQAWSNALFVELLETK